MGKFVDSQVVRKDKEDIHNAAYMRRIENSRDVHPEFGNSYANLGAAYADMKDYVKAIVYYEEALDILRNVKGGGRKLKEVYDELARLNMAVGNESRAEQCMYQAKLIKL